MFRGKGGGGSKVVALLFISPLPHPQYVPHPRYGAMGDECLGGGGGGVVFFFASHCPFNQSLQMILPGVPLTTLLFMYHLNLVSIPLQISICKTLIYSPIHITCEQLIALFLAYCPFNFLCIL